MDQQASLHAREFPARQPLRLLDPGQFVDALLWVKRDISRIGTSGTSGTTDQPVGGFQPRTVVTVVIDPITPDRNLTFEAELHPAFATRDVNGSPATPPDMNLPTDVCS